MKLGFKKRIFLSTVLLLVTSLSITNWISYKNFNVDKVKEIEDKSFLILENSKNAIELWLKMHVNVIESAISTYSNGSRNKLQTHNATANMLRKAGGFTKVSISYFDGNFYGAALDDPYYFSRPSSNTNKDSWYQEAINNQGVLLTEIYDKEKGDNSVLNIAASIREGVLSAALPLKMINALIDIKQFKEATATVLDSDFNVLASTDLNVELGSYNDIPDIEIGIKQHERGSLDYVHDGVDKRVYFTQIDTLGNNKWYLWVSVDKKVAYAEVEDAFEETVITSLIIILLASFAVIIILRQLFRPILELKQTINDLSQGNGDLTRRLEVRSQDDLGQIASGVNTFIANLQQMMLEVRQSTLHISEGIDQLHTQSEVNNTLLQAHVEETDQVVASVGEMNLTADTVAHNASKAASFTLKANKEAQSSKYVVSSAVDSVTSLVQEVESMEGNVQSMNEFSQGISSILAVIGEIADQTNLLALNAAIEAARAGEQGRGFAVVADEVRTLASRTQQSTAEIDDMLSKLADGSELIVAAMDKTKDQCEQTAENTAQVHGSLDIMNTSVEEISNINNQIAGTAEKQSGVAAEINRNMIAISKMVTELSANAEITITSAQNLAAANTQLTGIVDQFKLK